MEKSSKISLLSSIVLVGFVFGVFYCYIYGFYFRVPTLYNSFLYPAYAAFCDFYDPLKFITDFKFYSKLQLWVVYFPLAYIVVIPFAYIKNKFISYLIFLAGFLYYWIGKNKKELYCENLSKIQNFQNIFIITAISYPFLYLVDKGNFDMYMLILLGAFTYFFNKEKYMKASIFLAITNAMKPFSIFFVLLFLLRKKYKEAFASLALTAILVIGGFMVLHDNFLVQIVDFLKTLVLFKDRYTYQINEWFGMAYSSSLYMVFKLFLCKYTAVPIVPIHKMTSYYSIFSYIVTAITLVFVCREKILWKQLTLLICNFLVLPYITYDYKLIFLFLPLWLFINEKEKTKFDMAYTILFALLLIPKHIVIPVHALSPSMANFYSISIIINPIIMILLSLLIILEKKDKCEN